ncbi:MAG: flagellar hook assembly protein FlgD [Kofleriaceae bacterium]|nr:flagellar hook assembly protein FlgD [Kofleriaceae bacterium]
MSITGVSSSTQSTDTTSTPGMKGTKDEFLKLFMAQLQYQDPFAPTSGADMVAQLAQLSSVEQAKQTNDTLADLATAQNAVANANLASLVGRDCNATAAGFSIDEAGGTPPPLDVKTATPTKDAAIVITDANGKEIRRIPIPDGSTQASVAWDGKDANGQPVKPGSYSISVDAGKSASTINASWHGRVDSLELTAEGPRLRIGGVLIAPGDIHTIGNTSDSATGQKA